MTSYAPNSPLLAGMEWPVSRQRDLTISSSLGRAALIEVSTTQTFNQVRAFLHTTSGQIFVGPNARYGIDVYNAADMDPGAVQYAYSLPDADRSSSGLWVNHLGAGSPLWSDVDDWPASLAADDLTLQYGFATGGHGQALFSASSTWSDLFTGSPVSLSTKRILGLHVDVTVQVGWPTGVYNVQGLLEVGGVVQPSNIVGVTFTGNQSPRTTTVTRQLQFYFGAAAWRNYEGFRPTDITDLQSAGGFGLSVFKVPTDTVGSFFVLNTRLIAAYVNEKRILTGWTGEPSGIEEWVSVAMTNPSTGVAASATKTAGQRLLVVARSDYLSPNNTLRALDCGNTRDHTTDRLNGYVGVDVPFQNTAQWWSAGLPAADFTVPATNDEAIESYAPSFFLTNSGTVRVDGQPYGALGTMVLTAGQQGGQEFTAPASTTFAEIRFLILNNAAAHAAGTVTVEVRRLSDNALMGAAASWVPSTELPAADGKYVLARARLATAATLVSGTQYYVRFTISTGTLTFPRAEEGTGGFVGDAAGAGGSANQAFDPAAPLPAARLGTDLAGLTVGQVPAQLAGQTLVSEALDTDRGLVNCVVSTINFARLDWTTTAHGVLFDAYEIERNEAGEGYVPIGEITAEAHSTFGDLELRRNVAVLYRARVRWTTGSVGDWRVFGFGVNIATPDEWGLILCNNAVPLATLALQHDPDNVDWRPQDAQRLVTKMLTGRDRPLAFRETERRGDQFSRTLILGINEASHGPGETDTGRAVFDTLETLLHNPALPYVAVIDGRGRRWFTAPTIQRMREIEPHRQYLADVDFTEVAGPAPAITDQAGF